MSNLPGALLFTIPIVAIVAGVVVTWIRAKHGLLQTTDQLNKRLETESAKRDKSIAELERRIRVLERIVTDKSTSLDREFESLRD